MLMCCKCIFNLCDSVVIVKCKVKIISHVFTSVGNGLAKISQVEVEILVVSIVSFSVFSKVRVWFDRVPVMTKVQVKMMDS